MALGAAVKGITIEFEANTTKLGTALKGIESQSKSLGKSIRDVDRALRFNPGNTQLIAQKQQLLGQQIGKTKEKLEQLKKAQATLDDDPAVDKTSQEYMELQREIITTESKLKHFNAEMEKLKNIKFDQLGQKFQDIGGKMESVGKGMTQKVTAPIIGLGAASVKSFKDVDAGLDIVIQKTGASGKAAEAMKKTVKDLATSIPTDFETAGAAVGEVNTRFGVTGKELEKLSGKFVKFAKLNDMDVSSSIDETQKALSAFGLESKDAGDLLDQLNKVGQDTGADMGTLLKGLVQNATAFQKMGLSAKQSATLMGQMEKSGANSETVMQGLRKALKNATEAGVPLDEALIGLQKSIEGGADGMDGLTYSYKLFGKSGDQIYGAIKNGTLDFKSLGQAASDAGGSVDKTFNETLDPVDKFSMAMNEAKVTGAEVGSSLLTILTPALEKISSTLQKVAKWWEGLSPGMQQFIIKLALVAAAVGPFLVVVGKMLIGFGTIIKLLPSIIKGFQLVGLAFKALGAAFSANPIILAVMAAIAVGILLYKNWDKVKKFLIKIWNGLSKAVSKAFGAIKKAVSGAWDGIKEKAAKAWDGVKAAVMEPLRWLAANIKFTILKIKTTLASTWDSIKAKAKAVWDSIKSTAQSVWKGIKDAITKPINDAKAAVANAYDAMKKKVAEKVSAAASWVSDVKDKISGAIGKAKDAVNSGYDAMKKKVGEKVSAAGSWITEVKNKISNAISAAATSVKDNYNSMKAKVGEKVSATDTWNGSVKDKIKNAINTAKDAVSSGIEKIKGYLGQKVSLSSSLSGFGSAIADKASTAWKAVRDAFNNIKGKIGSIHIKFPSIKLPHFRITSKGKFPWGVGGKGSLPSWDVSWYARGGIFTKPTLLNGGTVGVGEAGAEAVLPLERLFSEMNGMFNSMADNIVNGLITAQRLQSAGQMAGDIHLDVYLYPSGPKMREEIVHAYDEGKKILG